MQVSISGQHVEVTTALRQYVTRKLERIDRHTGLPLIRGHVVLHVEKNRYWARRERLGHMLRKEGETRSHVTQGRRD